MDSASLRKILLRTNMTPGAIQSSAGAIMGHYDRIPSIAVDEWRQCLTICEKSQLLPLLYVCNEVLQTSKRNRGNKLLESFAPVLTSSLGLIADRNRGIVEKVRRVAKIWGDRQVFSRRFVNDVLNGMEAYRASGSGSKLRSGDNDNGRGVNTSNRDASLNKSSFDGSTRNSTNISSSGRITSSSRNNNSFDTSSQEDSPFIGGDSSGSSLLDVNKILRDLKAKPLDSAERDRVGGDSSRKVTKRKRTSKTSGSKTKLVKKKITLLDLLDEMDVLNGQFKLCMGVMDSFPESYFSEDESTLDNIVGDDLSNMYSKVTEAGQSIAKQSRTMHYTAQKKHDLEQELLKCIPSLRDSVRQDDEDLNLCTKLEEKLMLLLVVHGAAKEAYAKKKDDEAKKHALAEEEAKKREEEMERKRLLAETMKSSTQSAPGMVWNPVTRQYQQQHDHTAEDWRD